jgi:DNA-binding NarL/FixJ family response regulator
MPSRFVKSTALDLANNAPPDLEVAELNPQTGETILAFSLPPLHRPSCLTQAEWDVVQQVASGRSNGEIASQRHTSMRTVANQLQNIFRKLEVKSRLELLQRLSEDPPLEAQASD